MTSSGYLDLPFRTESEVRATIREHQVKTLAQLEAAYDYAHDCENWPVLDGLRTRINALKLTLGLDMSGNADREHEQDEKAEQGFRMYQGGQP